MRTERWQRISGLFHAASKLSPAEQREFIAAECANDDALRREIESLLTRATSSTDPDLREPLAPGLSPGQVVGARYRIVAFLGRGGMGEVYRADDLQLGQPIALKFVTPSRADWDTTQRNRFLNEVRLARQVTHPNVCRVYDLGEERGLLYLSMEYVDGEDLSSLLRRIGRLPVDKALQVGRQICAGLAAAHANGIVHLDLKPANVMIDGRGVARITDFGIAALPGEATTLAGTPAYMAPEQVNGESLSIATDIFALGLVLYEIFTGHAVFPASISERRTVSANFEPPSPSTYVAGLDVSIDRVILQCLAKRPTDRPQSAVAVAANLPGADVLTASLAAGHIPSPDVIATYGARQTVRRLPTMLLFGATLIATLLAAKGSGAMMLFRHVNLSKPPAVLEDRATALLATLEQVARPVDRAAWYTSLFSYAAQARSVLNDQARPSTPPTLLYVTRQSPRYLTPKNLFATVAYRDPPFDVPGMADIALYGDGSLVRFAVVPRRSDDATSLPNWRTFFEAAGLDIGQFSEAPTHDIVPVLADSHFAWTGVHHGWADTPVKIIGATFAGRPVYFDIRRETAEPIDDDGPASTGETVAVTTVLILLCIAWGGAAALARRNLRRGQGDRRGARRLVIYFATSTTAMGLLGAHHVPDFLTEYFTFLRVAAWTTLWSASLYLFYLGFEPLVRRRWPQLLVSWTSVISGKWRDPNAGREVLIGVGAGVAAMLWLETEFAVSQSLLGMPLRFVTFSSELYAFRDVRFVASLACFVQSDALSAALVSLFLVALFRELFGRQWLANVAWVLVTAPVMMFGDSGHAGYEFAFAVTLTAFGLFVLMRVGFLAFATTLLVLRVLTYFPVTLDLSVWYAYRSATALIAIAGLAGFGCYAALDRPHAAPMH